MFKANKGTSKKLGFFEKFLGRENCKKASLARSTCFQAIWSDNKIARKDSFSEVPKIRVLTLITTFLSIILSQFSFNSAFACACGCGVFNVGTSSLIPNCSGGTAFLQYDQMNQTKNFNGSDSSNNHNHDKKISTKTYTLGAQYMFNRGHGLALRLPLVNREIHNVEHEHGSSEMKYGDYQARNLGDMKINGIFSGFSQDMSSGLIYGLKLPTGRTSQQNIERNQQIGTKSTDLLLGAYYMGYLSSFEKVGYFVQGSWQQPFITKGRYNLGYELSASAGYFYQINLNQTNLVKKISPIFQFTATKKDRDSGFATSNHNKNSGYEMAFFAPGLEVGFGDYKIYGDVELPIYRYVNGTQLIPQKLVKMILSRSF